MNGATVRLIDVPAMARWIARHGVEELIERLVSRLRADFLRWEEFDKTPRVASHSARGVIELMPVSDGRRYTFKYVNGHPDNPSSGLQTVTAFGVLADVASGYPLLIAEMTLLTALRTAATSALAASVLARPDSRVLALIGTGSQAEFQALAFRRMLGIDRLRVWDTDPRALDKFERNARGLGFTVVRASSAAEAVAGADVVTTCTADKALATVLTDESVVAGMHLNAIGGDCPGKTELDPAILRRAAVFAEYLPQSRIEGEIQQLEEDFPAVELWRVLSGAQPGRTDPNQVTVFDSVGFAVEDFSALCLLADEFDGAESAVDLVADPHDPKDLFSLIASAGTQR